MQYKRMQFGIYFSGWTGILISLVAGTTFRLQLPEKNSKHGLKSAFSFEKMILIHRKQ